MHAGEAGTDDEYALHGRKTPIAVAPVPGIAGSAYERPPRLAKSNVAISVPHATIRSGGKQFSKKVGSTGLASKGVESDPAPIYMPGGLGTPGRESIGRTSRPEEGPVSALPCRRRAHWPGTEIHPNLEIHVETLTARIFYGRS